MEVFKREKFFVVVVDTYLIFEFSLALGTGTKASGEWRVASDQYSRLVRFTCVYCVKEI
jgi:hypothetical protein